MVRHTYICCWLKFMAAKDSMCQDRFCFFFWGEPHVILGVAKGRAQSKSLWSDFRWLVWLGSTPSGAKAKAMAKRYHKVANSNSSISNLTPGHSAVALLIACNLPFCANKIMHKNDTQWSMAKEYQVCLSQFDSPSSRSSWPISCRSGCWQCLRWSRGAVWLRFFPANCGRWRLWCVFMGWWSTVIHWTFCCYLFASNFVELKKQTPRLQGWHAHCMSSVLSRFFTLHTCLISLRGWHAHTHT